MKNMRLKSQNSMRMTCFWYVIHFLRWNILLWLKKIAPSSGEFWRPAANIVLWCHFRDIRSHQKVPQYKTKKTGQAFLNSILAFQMPGTYILARRPILLNIIRKSVFSEAGLQIPNIFQQFEYAVMNYSKTLYMAMQCSSVPSHTVYITANSLPSTKY